MNEIVGSTYLKQMKDESENLFFFVAGLYPTSTLLILLIAYVNLLFFKMGCNISVGQNSSKILQFKVR